VRGEGWVKKLGNSLPLDVTNFEFLEGGGGRDHQKKCHTGGVWEHFC